VRAVNVTVKFPSGMTVTEAASYAVTQQCVFVSARLTAILREFNATEAPPMISAVIDGEFCLLEHRANDTLGVMAVDTNDRFRLRRQLVQVVRRPSRDQRQQFGRFLHTLSTAAFIGAIGLWHATTEWTWANVLNEADLVLAFVLSFVIGMISMDGE
jgi:hypothetical protein